MLRNLGWIKEDALVLLNNLFFFFFFLLLLWLCVMIRVLRR